MAGVIIKRRHNRLEVSAYNPLRESPDSAVNSMQALDKISRIIPKIILNSDDFHFMIIPLERLHGGIPHP